MQRDFKTGLLVGALAVIAVTVWLSTRPKLSVAGRAHITAPNAVSASKVTEKIPSAAKVESAFPDVPEKVPRTPNNEPRTMNPDKIGEHPARFHIVQSGDTLSFISEKYYGSPNQWQKIFFANDNVIKDPSRLIPGTRLLIPE